MGFVSSEEAAQNKQNNVGYTIQIGGPPPQPKQEEQFQMTPEMQMQAFNGKMRNVFAEARVKEADLLLSYMHEIRGALNMQSLTVCDGDTGSKDRPPLEPAFRGDVRDKLQQVYLRLAERTINHTENFLRREMGISLTNEIKLQPPRDEQSIS